MRGCIALSTNSSLVTLKIGTGLVVQKMVDREFWRGKKVFVTGHTGFKGAWLSHWLHCLGARVTGFSKRPSSQQMQLMGNTNKFSGGSIIGDICDFQHLTDSVKQSQSEIIFHLAAQPIVRRSYDSAIETFETNLMGTVHLLETMKHTESLRAAVIVTSDKCYNNYDVGVSFKEDSPLGGDDPYSASKACAEIATQSFIRSFFKGTCNRSNQVKIATARAGNIIGGGDWGEDRLIPDIVRAIQLGENIQIRSGNPALAIRA